MIYDNLKDPYTGAPCSLIHMCRVEPEWAANIILAERARSEKAEAEALERIKKLDAGLAMARADVRKLEAELARITEGLRGLFRFEAMQPEWGDHCTAVSWRDVLALLESKP